MSKAWAGGSTTAWRKTRLIVLARDGYTCQIRTEGRCTVAATHVDHIISKAKGGTDELTNLQAACRPCNLHKGDRAGSYINPDPEPLAFKQWW